MHYFLVSEKKYDRRVFFDFTTQMKQMFSSITYSHIINYTGLTLSFTLKLNSCKVPMTHIFFFQVHRRGSREREEKTSFVSMGRKSKVSISSQRTMDSCPSSMTSMRERGVDFLSFSQVRRNATIMPYPRQQIPP